MRGTLVGSPSSRAQRGTPIIISRARSTYGIFGIEGNAPQKIINIDE
jgi:hypothetical protein